MPEEDAILGKVGQSDGGIEELHKKFFFGRIMLEHPEGYVRPFFFDHFFNDRRPAPAIFASDLETFDIENEYATLCNLKLDLLKRGKFPT